MSVESRRSLEQRVAAIRRFNRFYTQRIGVLREGLLDSPFTLTEVRVLYELAHREHPTASELGQALDLDAGYLSRILRAFAKQQLITKQPSPRDGRQVLLSLTRAGKKVLAPLDARSRGEVAALLKPLAPREQRHVVEAMRTLERLLGAPAEAPRPYRLRAHRPGDMGWVVHRHGVLYAQEYGWDERFEALVARVVADFIQHFDAKRERCWMAELDGEPVGSVFLVRKSDTVARLRLLLVEPRARGLGIGAKLVEECLRFARHARYRKVVLWTSSALLAARRLYEHAGFRLIHEAPQPLFGPGQREQTWELKL
ncbi:MarR family transcriptional regulator [Corallococcus sp. H22C18031201]|nr:MarR family transcriptional regulator [Corallococcus sp. H22C18031201]